MRKYGLLAAFTAMAVILFGTFSPTQAAPAITTVQPVATITASGTPVVGQPVTFTAPDQSGVAYQWTLSWSNPVLHTNRPITRGVGSTFTYTPSIIDSTRVDTLLLVVSTGRVGPRAQAQVSFQALTKPIAPAEPVMPVEGAVLSRPMSIHSGVSCNSWIVSGFPAARAAAKCTSPFGWILFRVHATCYIPPFDSHTVTGPWVTVASGSNSTSDLCIGGSISNRYAETNPG